MKKIKVFLKRYSMFVEIAVAFLLTIGMTFWLGKTRSREFLLIAIIMIAMYAITRLGFRNCNKRRAIFAAIFAVPFGLAFWLGQKVVYQSTDIRPFEKGDLLLMPTFILLAALLVVIVLAFIDRKSFAPNIKKKQIFKKHSWLWYTLVIIACYVPLFLVFFPGLISVDSAVQLNQAIGEGAWSNWHPVLHTAFVALPVNIGYNLFGDLTAGIALSTILQMVLLGTIFGYIVKWSIEKTSKRWIGGILLVFFALCPIVACYSVTMWKDVLFSAVFALLIVKIYDLICSRNRDARMRLKEILGILALTLLVGFLRNGGVLIIVALGLAFLIYYRKSRVLTAVGFGAIALMTVIVQGPIYKIMGITSSPFMESMSVPAQQIGYVVQTGEVSDEVEKELARFADIDCLKRNYSPMNADPAKNCFNYAAVNDDKMGLIKVWFSILPNHIGDYVKAYILHTYSYWYIQGDVWVLDFGHIHEDTWLNADYTDVSLLGDTLKKAVERVENGVTVSVWFGWMNNVGVMFWGMVLMLMIFLYQKKYAMLVPLAGVFVYMASLLIASPVSWIFRYVYSLLLILPILVVVCFIKDKKGKKE